MGRKTWESLPDKSKPLKERINIILTSKSDYLKTIQKSYGEVYVCNSLENALQFIDTDLFDSVANTFIIGGSLLYEEALNHDNSREVFLTRVGIDYSCDKVISKDSLKNYIHLETSRSCSENLVPFDFQRFISKKYHNESNGSPIFRDQHEEFQYLSLIEKIIQGGTEKDDRTGVGTVSTFGEIMKFSLQENFPLLTTKEVFWRGVVEELLWFIKGDTNSNKLTEKKVHIWDANGSREFLDKLGFKNREEGDLGPIYGFQWRHFGANYINKDTNYTGQGVDQLNILIDTLKKNPDSRRMILTAWNPAALHLMALPPCHAFSQFYVNKGKLSCLMYQRSCDLGLGVPFNIASYSLLTCMLAQVCGLERGEFIHVLGDAHVYKDHLEPIQIQLKRIPRPFPCLLINQSVKNIDDFVPEDLKLVGYNPHGKVKMKMAV